MFLNIIINFLSVGDLPQQVRCAFSLNIKEQTRGRYECPFLDAYKFYNFFNKHVKHFYYN